GRLVRPDAGLRGRDAPLPGEGREGLHRAAFARWREAPRARALQRGARAGPPPARRRAFPALPLHERDAVAPRQVVPAARAAWRAAPEGGGERGGAFPHRVRLGELAPARIQAPRLRGEDVTTAPSSARSTAIRYPGETAEKLAWSVLVWFLFALFILGPLLTVLAF